MDGAEFSQVPRAWKLKNGRERLCHWRNSWMNVEVGLSGDLDPFGFVDAELHGGSEAVSGVQDHLLRGVRTLLGHKVMLVKHLHTAARRYGTSTSRRPKELDSSLDEPVPR